MIFKNKILGNQLQEKLKQFEERLAEERHNRLEERKRQRKEERRITYYREKEEEEQRRAEEQMRKGNCRPVFEAYTKLILGQIVAVLFRR